MVAVDSYRRRLNVTITHWLLICVLLPHTFTLARTQESCIDHDDGAVRLVGGLRVDKLDGRLEICVGGEWGTVCNDGISEHDGFDIDAAKVVCRQLGIQGDEALSNVVTNVFYGGGRSTQRIHLSEVQCTGTEMSLLNCTHKDAGMHSCHHGKDVGIICKLSQNCTDGDVRLVDGNNYNATAGRVEYCVAGLWGTVCNWLWSIADATVVCRQLELNALEPRVLQDVPQVENRQTPFVLDGVECRSTEDKLGDCRKLSYVQDCSHLGANHHNAGAFCTNIRVCNDGDVRLVQVDEDQAENEGRVEFCSSGQWGMVCYDGWDNNDAQVVCRQRGYNVEGTYGYALATQSTFSREAPPTLLNKVNCIGTENTISECPESSSRCLAPGAGVICPVQNITNCTDGEVRLQGGELSSEIGRVEMCISGGQWGLVCDGQWDDIDASVVCRQLGFTGGVATHLSVFGTIVDGHFVLDDVNCTGNESNIFDCQYPPHADCDVGREEAGVICGVTPGPSERCIGRHVNKTISIVGSSATNLTAGSIGTCQRYLRQSNICNSVYESSDYIFTAMNQTLLSEELDRTVFPVLREDCGDLISKVLCHYFFPPCGANGLLHLPLTLCPEECHYVETACADQWKIVNNLLAGSTKLNRISCKATGALLQGLTPCCIDAGIEIKDGVVQTNTENYDASTTHYPTDITYVLSHSTVIVIAISATILAIVIFILGYLSGYFGKKSKYSIMRIVGKTQPLSTTPGVLTSNSKDLEMMENGPLNIH